MATVFEKLNKLNLIGKFISNFLANLSFGYIYNAVVGEMNPKFFALTTAASCLSSILFVQLNKKNLLYKWFSLFLILETLFFIVVSVFCIYTQKFVIYEIFLCVNNFVLGAATGACINKFRGLLYNSPSKRELYDNDAMTIQNSAILISSLMAFIIIDKLNLTALVIISVLTVIVDNIIVIIIQRNLKLLATE